MHDPRRRLPPRLLDVLVQSFRVAPLLVHKARAQHAVLGCEPGLRLGLLLHAARRCFSCTRTPRAARHKVAAAQNARIFAAGTAPPTQRLQRKAARPLKDC